MPELKYFVSHSRKDSAFVKKLAEELRSFRVNLWIDQLDIPPNRRWDKSIEQALHDCGGILIVLSPESVISENVLDEVAFALEEGKTIVSILVRHCKIPYRLRRLQHIDFTNNYDTAFSKLLKALKEDENRPMYYTPNPIEDKWWIKYKIVFYRFAWVLALFIAVSIYVAYSPSLLKRLLRTNTISIIDTLRPYTAKVDGVVYELVLSEFQGNHLVILFSAYNPGAEVIRSLSYNSYLIDESGIRHNQVGRTDGLHVGGMDFFEVSLPSDITSRLGLVFNDVSPKEHKIQYVRIDFRESAPLEMRNIPIPYKKPVGHK